MKGFEKERPLTQPVSVAEAPYRGEAAGGADRCPRGPIPRPTTQALVASQISQPTRLLRIASVARAMLEEARSASCDADGCALLAEVYRRTIIELGDLLSPELMDELSHLVVPFERYPLNSAQVRIAQAELVGWLEGLVGSMVAVGALYQGPPARSSESTSPSDDPLPGQYL